MYGWTRLWAGLLGRNDAGFCRPLWMGCRLSDADVEVYFGMVRVAAGGTVEFKIRAVAAWTAQTRAVFEVPYLFPCLRHDLRDRAFRGTERGILLFGDALFHHSGRRHCGVARFGADHQTKLAVPVALIIGVQRVNARVQLVRNPVKDSFFEEPSPLLGNRLSAAVGVIGASLDSDQGEAVQFYDFGGQSFLPLESRSYRELGRSRSQGQRDGSKVSAWGETSTAAVANHRPSDHAV